MIPSSAAAALSTMNSIVKTIDNFSSSKSLIDITRPLTVEPLVFIENALVHATDIMPDILQTLQSQFTGFWLQAVDIIGDLEAAKALSVLEQINPSRNTGYFNMVTNLESRMVSREGMYFDPKSYKHGLPTNHSPQVRTAAREADDGKIKDVAAAANLAVGKMVSVTIKNGEVKRDFKVAIRLMALEVDSESLTHLASDTTVDVGFFNRLNRYRNDEIGLSDLLFSLDLVRERKRQLLKDKSGVYEMVRKRQLGHKRAYLLTGAASEAEISNLVVVTKEFTENLAIKHGLDVEDAEDRNKIMKNLMSMILVVVDRRDMRVRFYYHGLRNSSSMGVNDIRIANRKQSGPDLMDIFAAFKEGAPPRF